MLRSSALAIGALAALLLSGCVSTGQLAGHIKFTNAPGASPVREYLEAHAAAAGADSAVRLHAPGAAPPPGQLVAPPAATTGYAVAAGSGPGVADSEFRVASYAVNASVAAVGATAFNIEVDSVRFAGGAEYRFGTRLSGAIGTHVSPVVPPTGSVTADLAEEACLIGVNVRLTGPDVDAIPHALPILCSVAASVEERPGSNVFSLQATASSGPVFRDELRDSGVVVDMLVRQGAPRVAYQAWCVFTPPPDSGFAVDDEGTAVLPLPEPGVPPTPGTTQGCNGAGSTEVDVPVERRTGTVKGLFDIVGETETAASVHINLRRFPSREVAPPLYAAGQPVDPAAPWRIENVPAGHWEAYAHAVVRDGDIYARLPHRVRANTTVPVVDNETTDLGSTFITRPTVAVGSLLLKDPAGTSGLDRLRTGRMPLNTLPSGQQISYVIADGLEEVPNLPGGASGILGASYGRLRVADGSDTTACGSTPLACELGYSLLLTGLSPQGGATDGADTRPTPWKIDGIRLSYGDTNANFARTYAYLQALNQHVVGGPAAAEVPIAVPRVEMCLGQIGLDIRMDSAFGALRKPSFTAWGIPSGDASAAPSDVRRMNVDYAEGLPKSEGAEAVATVAAPVSDGIRYTVAPRVYIGASDVALPEITLPAFESGVLGCGQTVRACIKINGSSGEASTPLNIGIGQPAACSPDGSVSLVARVDSGGLPVASMRYQVVGSGGVAETGTLCEPCGADPTRALPAAGQPPLRLPEGGTVVVTAEAGNGCVASYTHHVTVPAAGPSLQCPADLSLWLDPGEESIAQADARVAPWLRPPASGGCGMPTVSHDHAGAFAQGTSPVTFSLNGAPQCTRNVTVRKSRKQIAFFDINRLRLYRLEDSRFHWTAALPAGSAGPISFSRDGAKLAVRSPGEVKIFDAETGMAEAAEIGIYADFAFRPGTEAGTVHDRAGLQLIAGVGWLLNLRLSGSAVASIVVPGATAGSVVSGPRLAWSDDGARIAVAFIANGALQVREWAASPGQVTGQLGDPGGFAVVDGDDRVLGLTYERFGNSTVRLLMATNKSLYRAGTGAAGQWQAFFAAPMHSVDLHRTAPMAIDLGSTEPFFAALAEVPFLPPPPQPGAWLPWGPVRGVAASDFPFGVGPGADPAIGVALRGYVVPATTPSAGPGPRWYVALYRLELPIEPGSPTGLLVLERLIDAQEPAFPRFRPYMP